MLRKCVFFVATPQCCRVRFPRSVQEAASRRRRGHGRHGTHPRVPAAPPSRRRSAAHPQVGGLDVLQGRPSSALAPQLPVRRRCDHSDTFLFPGHPLSDKRWRHMIVYDWKPFPGSCREPLRLRSARSRAIIRVQLCRRCLVNRGPAGHPPPTGSTCSLRGHSRGAMGQGQRTTTKLLVGLAAAAAGTQQRASFWPGGRLRGVIIEVSRVWQNLRPVQN